MRNIKLNGPTQASRSERKKNKKFKLKLFVIVTDVHVVTATVGYRTGTVYTTERLSKIYMKATRQDEKQQNVCNMFVSKAELKHEKPNESQQDIVCIVYKTSNTQNHE